LSPRVQILLVSVAMLVALSMGCILRATLSISPIVIASDVYGFHNYTAVTSNILGDDQSVYFYVEVRNFETRKTKAGYEFWVSMDITIRDQEGNRYVERMDDKEIHVTNATERPGAIFYDYPWFTGNMVKSGAYFVKIVAKDKLSGQIAETEKEFDIDLSKKP